MALPNISLAQFNAISNGSYNAGQIDFGVGRNGETELVKVNNHVVKKSQNNVVLSPERILEIKETFLNALRNGGVAPDKMAEIRDRLGLPTELGTRVGKEQRQGILQARFTPLTRAQVRAILDEYADGGRGFTEESRAAVSRKDFAKGQAAANLGGSDAAKRDAINAEALQRHSQRGNASVDFSVTDALSILSGARTLSDLDAARSRRIGGENAENERTMKNEELATGFARLFAVALKMLPADAHESEEFRLCGETVKLVKGDDGKLTAILGKGELKTNVALGTDVDSLVTRLIGRCVEDRETIGSLTLKGIVSKVYDRDIKAGLVASDRTSLTRKLASVLISMISSDRATGGVVNVDTILNGNYNTGLLVDIAQKALAGEDIGTKEKLDAYHAKIVRDTAALPPEIKAMLEQVANVPIEKLDEDKGEFIVRNPIVAGMNEVAPVPQQPAAAPPENLRDIGGASAIKDFVADLVFSDDTMVADVVVNRPGETMRAMLSTDKRLLAFSEIVKNRAVLDTAVSEKIRAVVKAGFDTMVETLDGAWRASHNGETIDAASKKPDFLARFSAFIKSADQLPGEKLAEFDAIIQSMANSGCEKIQDYINTIFKVNVEKANANDAGSLVNAPYVNKKPEDIKTLLKEKSLNQILDTASNSEAPGQVGFFRQVISTYFTSLSNADKRSCFAASMRYARDFDFTGKQGKELESANSAANNKFAGAILKGTSPLLQKMMQGLPKDVMGEFSDALEDMKCNLAPMPRKIVQAHLMKLINDSNGKIKSIKLQKSLGAASVGEAFLCEIVHETRAPKLRQTTDAEKNAHMGSWTEVRDNNGAIVYENKIREDKVVIKIMRHDAERRMEAEAEIFTTAAKKIPGMEKTWEGQLAQYRKEFDFRIEARNVRQGVKIYDVSGGKNQELDEIAHNVSCMKLSNIVPTKKDVLVAEVATGSTADRYFKKSIAEVRDAASGVFEQDPETGRIKWQDGPVDAKTGKPTRIPVFRPDFKFGSLGHLQQWVSDNYADLELKQSHLLQATKLWFYEALFGSGKFHGDTHAGNLMVAANGVTFIDFGNLFQLKTHYELDQNNQPVKERIQTMVDGHLVTIERDKVRLNEKHELLRIMTGAAFRDKNFFLEGFERLLSESGKATLKANRAKAEAILDTVLGKGKFAYDIIYRLNAAVAELQKLGLELPPQINCFIQSMARLANSITEMNTIMKQYKALLDAANGYTLVGPAPKRDELDVIGRAFDFFATEDAKKMVANNDRLGNGLPDEITTFHKFLIDNKPGDAYRSRVAERLINAADPKAEAQRLVEMLSRHLDAGRNVNNEVAKENIDRALEAFRREVDENGGANRIEAIAKFAIAYVNQGVIPTFQAVRDAMDYVARTEINPPKTFASALVSLLLDNFDAMQGVFSIADGVKVYADAKLIAMNELGKHLWSSKETVMEAMKDDAKNTAADTDTSSYRIDIGV